MFKLVVLLSVLSVVAAKPGWGAPITYTKPPVGSETKYLPGVRGFHQVATAPAVVVASEVTPDEGVHSVAKRSVVAPFPYTSFVVPVSPLVRNVVSPYYTTPYVSGYTPYAYPAVVPKAFSVHPW